MAERTEVYKCALCGNIVEVMHGSVGELACCGQAMDVLKENSVDAATEKHVPVITKSAGGYTVNVGSVDHPMTAEHFIEWIELIAGDSVLIQFLNPGDKPQAFFATSAANPMARAYCNLHGLWKN